MREAVARNPSSSAPANSPMAAVENELRSLREETDRIIHSKNLTPESSALYDLRRQAIFNRLRSYLRAGDGAT
jgi:hypothetical protein